MEYHQNPSFEDKCKIVASCDFSIHPSVFETWNLTSMESMALGVPVVGVNSKGIMEYADNKNSVLFEDRNVNLICDTIEKISKEDNIYKALQEEGAKTARNHNWNFIMSQIEKSYMSFIDDLEKEYQLACNGTIAEDIKEHIPTLRRYASECQYITELGVRTGASTRAFLAAKPKGLISVDIIPIADEVSRLKELVKDTNWQYVQANDLEIEIAETGLLFIDTYHPYDQLIRELTMHGNKARKYIILHDTYTWGKVGHNSVLGIMPAIKEFLSNNPHWVIKDEFENNNGLMVLERKIV
jgi:hypothetical protein